MRRRPSLSRGFTLLEILVVVVIIGILTALLLPNLASSGRWRDLNREAGTLAARIRVAQDDAMLYGREYGIVFSDRGYRFVAWDAGKKRFADVLPGQAWMLRELDDDIAIAASTDAKDAILVVPEPDEAADEAPVTQEAGNAGAAAKTDEPVYEPSVYVLSSGEVTPFSADFRSDGEEQFVTLYIDALGNRLDEKGELFGRGQNAPAP